MTSETGVLTFMSALTMEFPILECERILYQRNLTVPMAFFRKTFLAGKWVGANINQLFDTIRHQLPQKSVNRNSFITNSVNYGLGGNSSHYKLLYSKSVTPV
jgi:hypothetical protein